MSGMDLLHIRQHWGFLGSSIAEWFLLFLGGIISLFMEIWTGFLLMVFWIENFFFWLAIYLANRKGLKEDVQVE